MALLSIIIDSQIPAPGTNGVPTSLLTLPLGTSSFVERVATRLATLPDRLDDKLHVMPTCAVGSGYRRRLQARTSSEVHVVRPVELAKLLGDCELSDLLLLVDPGRWPAGEFDLSTEVARHADDLAATHLVGVGANGGRPRERVERDGQGHVRRVQRLYGGAAQPEVASLGIFASLVPAKAAGAISFISLAQLRAALAARGLLTRDVPLALDIIDLSQPEEVLALTEWTMEESFGKAPQAGFVLQRSGLLVGRACEIDPAARFVGPVILHDGVKVWAGATIVGPTVVGSGSVIEGGTIVAQSVLAPETLVESGMTLRHCIASGRCWGPTAEAPASLKADVVALDGATGYCPKQTGNIMSGRAPRPGRWVHLAAKRVMDVTCSAVGLVLLSPLFAVVAVLIKLGSPGPVLFIHRREQKGGKKFSCLKFRTMVADAHRQQRELYKDNEMDGPQFKLRQDPRVTRFGAWLRRTNIDELPQLVNVLLGHMSLVGPRPSPFRENQICVPWRRARLSVRPGITGLWQLCRSTDRSAGDFHEWIFYDIAYVRHFTIWLDIKILIATLVTGGRGSIPMSRLVREVADGARHCQQRLAI